ncbi:hypothetical protein HZH66_004792 [Vespula vulgaris]|uniref:Uncharacterized protein n=1 Tax=Vespula vulgaris TaxID=7454 RepID=A0A834NA95_VESVU|nr:hypothetical protein HZH66_004792 [Vespula vulgaris]
MYQIKAIHLPASKVKRNCAKTERFLSSQTCLIAFEGEKVVLVVGVAPTITIYCNMILCSTRSMTGYYPHAAPQDFHIAGNVVLSEIGRIITCLILNIAVTML